MSKGIHQDYLDKAVAPGDDFYMFVNGGWMCHTEIPADRSSWGSFHELGKNTDEKILAILDEELSIPGPATNKAARLFESGMDTKAIEKNGLGAIKLILTRIGELTDPDEIIPLIGFLISKGMGAVMHLGVHPDLGNSKIYAPYLEPGDLGLPERDFYLEEDDKAAQIRKDYQQYIIDVLHKEHDVSRETAFHLAEHILSLETELAGKMMSKEERRQLDRIYNPFSLEELSSRYDRVDWKAFFESVGIETPDRIIVTDPVFFDYLQIYLPTVSTDTLKWYLTFLSIHHVAPFVHASLEQRHFDFFSKSLNGVEVMRPRKERMVQVINQYLGEALGQLFVSKHFPPDAKAMALEMVDDIVTAFRHRISSLDWMGEETKKYALQKLASFSVKIGYPDVWKNYDDLILSGQGEEGSYLDNLLRVIQWKYKQDAAKIGNEVDRDEWFMAPQVVNAYYNPMFNEIVFPAAILQPPFFDWQADAAVNYGGIGAVIGHEITHGFDDQGSRFDKEGNLHEWWTAEDRERFNELTIQLIRQYDAYYPIEDLSINGTFTLGENIADLGGLSVAFDALQLYYKRKGKPEPIDGFTGEQRFFMSWATVWRTKIRPEALRTQIKTDPHPPGQFRAIGAPANLDSFYEAFDIFPHNPFYRKQGERIKIW